MNPALAHALALLASLAVVIAVVVLGYWLVFRWLDGETFGPREKPSQMTTEPDPIESYAPGYVHAAPSYHFDDNTNQRPNSEIVS